MDWIVQELYALGQDKLCKNEKDQKASFPELPHGLFINSLVAAYTVCQEDISVDRKKEKLQKIVSTEFLEKRNKGDLDV